MKLTIDNPSILAPDPAGSLEHHPEVNYAKAN